MKILTTDTYFENIEYMKNYLNKLELTIDTILELQGFEHNTDNGWINATDFNDWIESVIEFLDDCDETFQSLTQIEVNIAQFYILVEFAKVDILKNICKVY